MNHAYGDVEIDERSNTMRHKVVNLMRNKNG